MPTAEQQARVEIDRLLTAAGWAVQFGVANAKLLENLPPDGKFPL